MPHVSALRRFFALTIACAMFGGGCSQFGSKPASKQDLEQYSLLNEPLSGDKSGDASDDSSGELIASETEEFASPASHDRDMSFDAEALTLDQAIQTAISNSTFFRDRDQFLSRGNSILNQPLQAPSSFDLLIQQAGEQSVANALAAYSPNLTVGGLWGQNSIVQSNPSITSSDVLLNDNASAYARLYKPLQSGGIVSVTQNLNYASGNANQFLNPDFAGFVRGELRQPLLAGRGKQFTDIAGPLTYRSRSMGNGVTIATIREELPALQQHESIARLRRQTEELYWELWLADRTAQHHQSALDGAKELWDRIKNRATTGLPGGSVADLAQAEQNYYRQLKTLKNSESRHADAAMQLKRIMGISSLDDRTMQTAEEPLTAKIVYDLDDSLAIAMQQRVEPRRLEIQKQILELQMIPARSLTKPQLDLIAGAQLNGLGDGIFSASSPPTVSAEDVGWNVGLELTMPLGSKKERQNLKSLEHQISKADAAIAEQTNEIGYELGHAISQVTDSFETLELAGLSLASAQRRMRALEIEYNEGRSSIDRLIDAQLQLLEARIDIDRSLTEYNKAIAEVAWRRGE